MSFSLECCLIVVNDDGETSLKLVASTESFIPLNIFLAPRPEKSMRSILTSHFAINPIPDGVRRLVEHGIVVICPQGPAFSSINRHVDVWFQVREAQDFSS